MGFEPTTFWSWSVRSTSGLQPLHRYLNFLYLLGCKPFISKAMFENNKIFQQGSDFCQIIAEKKSNEPTKNFKMKSFFRQVCFRAKFSSTRIFKSSFKWISSLFVLFYLLIVKWNSLCSEKSWTIISKKAFFLLLQTFFISSFFKIKKVRRPFGLFDLGQEEDEEIEKQTERNAAT